MVNKIWILWFIKVYASNANCKLEFFIINCQTKITFICQLIKNDISFTEIWTFLLSNNITLFKLHQPRLIESRFLKTITYLTCVHSKQ